jgi:hypothetical protein
MANMFGKNREKHGRIFGMVIGVVVILSMILSYFALVL